MLDADTLKKLEARQVELAKVFVEETDTLKWPGDETQQQRGDRYWHKKNAGATATLIVKIQAILDVALKKPPMGDPKGPPLGDDDDERVNPGQMAEAAMAQAKQIIERHTGRFRRDKK